MDLNQIVLNGGIFCSVGKSLFGSTYSFLWSVVVYIGWWKCILIIIATILWIVWEIATKNTHSYNSENGFTTTFNSFIGASTYFWLQTFIYFILEHLFTSAVYCFKWPYILHTIVFLLTGFLLHITGIWPYWKIFGTKTRIR